MVASLVFIEFRFNYDNVVHLSALYGSGPTFCSIEDNLNPTKANTTGTVGCLWWLWWSAFIPVMVVFVCGSGGQIASAILTSIFVGNLCHPCHAWCRCLPCHPWALIIPINKRFFDQSVVCVVRLARFTLSSIALIIYLYTIPGIVVLVLCGQCQSMAEKGSDCVLLLMLDALPTIQTIGSYFSIQSRA